MYLYKLKIGYIYPLTLPSASCQYQSEFPRSDLSLKEIVLTLSGYLFLCSTEAISYALNFKG